MVSKKEPPITKPRKRFSRKRKPHPFWDWVDERSVVSRFVLGFTLWLTWYAVEWAMRYAESHQNLESLGLATVIGAVTGPVTLLQGSVFKTYSERRAAPRRARRQYYDEGYYEEDDENVRTFRVER